MNRKIVRSNPVWPFIWIIALVVTPCLSFFFLMTGPASFVPLFLAVATLFWVFYLIYRLMKDHPGGLRKEVIYEGNDSHNQPRNQSEQ